MPGRPASAAVDLDVLRRVIYLRQLPDEVISQVALAAVVRSYPARRVLFVEGGPCDGAWVVAKGRVRLFKVSPEGREQVILIATAGDSFNEVPVFDDGPNPVTAQALTPSTLYLLPKEAMRRLVRSHPELALSLLAYLSVRLRHLVGLVEDLAFRQSRQRVAKALLLWELEHGWAEPLSQAELAALAGTVREVANRVLHQLEQQGAVRLERGRVVAVDRRRLLELA
ncbi:MAG TPA: Crp/Fnr family transcriptional regulator [Dehalococcoidia bacterium]|nr:Crp/Fnr family transcriptional regulator [Dehalococcoidia bacterium]